MKDSRGMQRKQTTSYECGGWPQEVGVELRGNAGALSISLTSERGRNNMQKVETFVSVLIPGEPPYTERYVRWCGRTGVD
ncbi:MAG: hypothetical protein M1371_04660 [Actinobacteria bacterium]|nr:hypothetical protein [Actinomycetota bacterium]